MELKIIENIVRDAAKIIVPDKEGSGFVKKNDIEQKTSVKDLVTKYDKEVQEYLYKELSKAFPNAGFLGEESLQLPASEDAGTFIIDPIDGTTNFIKGLNHSAISVGYCLGEKMKYGVVYDPYKDEMFTAERGKGAFLNGEKIHVSDEPIERSVALYGTAPYNAELTDISFKLACELTKLVIDGRRFGAASLDFCDVAAGRAEIYTEILLCPWDCAAGSLIAEEAGAIVTDIYGKPLQFKEKTGIAVGTSKTYDILMETIKRVVS
ncbi:MAG: inositol monophosphatase [Clostridia bacterium]|nr:inositol monophosphatase [Clostridia bacterium]